MRWEKRGQLGFNTIFAERPLRVMSRHPKPLGPADGQLAAVSGLAVADLLDVCKEGKR